MRAGLSLPVVENSEPAKNAVPYTCSIWDRLDSAQKKVVNKLMDGRSNNARSKSAHSGTKEGDTKEEARCEEGWASHSFLSSS